MKTNSLVTDPFLEDAIMTLVQEHKCHTVILYGSRARGDATPHSDYDLMGVRKTGKKSRLAEERKGKFLDAFIFPEKDLAKVTEQHFYMREAQVLFEKEDFGSKFIQRLQRALKKPLKYLADDEIKARKIWSKKMLKRIEVGGIEGNYRRSWLQEALLVDYFELRKMRYEGSKASFAWLKHHDKRTFKLFGKALERPSDFLRLKKLVSRVIGG